ncbi:MAG: UDP-N-acetylmuramate dehydrogenase [Patescibacteria group bacterium]|nr:UDP-N-acetylmuramate dehydrogenase [Patescibacteria group bacterium]
MSNWQKNIPLKNFTTLQIGGSAQYFFVAKTAQELTNAIRSTKDQKISFLVVGGGSNLLIADEGYPGLIIKNALSGIKNQQKKILVQSGTALQELIDFTIKKGVAGLQKMTGIPGTVGGAIYGNAGAYGQTISDCLVEVTFFNSKTNKQETWDTKKCKFGYRDSAFKHQSLIILEAVFQLPTADASILKKEAAETLALRLAKYPPTLKCPGSFFKNVIAQDLDPTILRKIPSEKITFGKIPAGFLLETAGLKEAQVGQIQVSPNHANLFINLGNGSAFDFYQLAQLAQQKVWDKFGIKLEPEVQLVNLPALRI